MDWFEGELVICLVYLYPFALLLDFLYIHLSQLSFTYYTILYLLDYAYHCARVSRNEMQNSFVRPCYITYHDCNVEHVLKLRQLN
jgi:hypothetical protein